MLSLGRALMSKPRLPLLDEPSLGLAPLVVKEIFRSVRMLKDAGMTVLMVEQNAHAALALADRAYVLETGAVMIEGPGRTCSTTTRCGAPISACRRPNWSGETVRRSFSAGGRRRSANNDAWMAQRPIDRRPEAHRATACARTFPLRPLLRRRRAWRRVGGGETRISTSRAVEEGRHPPPEFDRGFLVDVGDAVLVERVDTGDARFPPIGTPPAPGCSTLASGINRRPPESPLLSGASAPAGEER